MRITVLGAGMVGRAIALDLANLHEVVSLDQSVEALQKLASGNPSIRTQQANLQDYSSYREWLHETDLVVSAVPGFMGYKTLETVIRCGKPVVDISFFPEDALTLDQLAKEKQVTAIVDCGVAPGLSNLALGYCDARMQVENFHCMVGGLPKERVWPFEYKAPFSPIDVLEEYSRPARYVEQGRIVTRPALSDPELIDFPGIGTLESFNTDGLRSILYTMRHIPNMKEKTLRYPGHIRLIEALIKSGFFDTTERMVNGQRIRPIDATASILFDQWKLDDNDEEFTVMKIEVSGTENGKDKKFVFDIYDERDKASGISSMSRTTGYTCTAGVQLIQNGLFAEKGVYPPELVGRKEGCFDFIRQYLHERAVQIKITEY
ncbi:MAG TPA: saccharopine dehydrogenase [Chitinophagaceae bacterium]|nr:saccharopine dehydrogenase [Chitinophagaceae bacterium]